MEQMDLILLVLDTQRADYLSCYGYPKPTSPYLDSFARHATVFRHAIAPAQWTVPTHASFFTGLYPSQHAVYQMDSVLPSSLPTLAERLSNHGYATAGFSQNPLIGLVPNQLTRGFQKFESFHLLSNILLTTRLHRPDLERRGFATIKQDLRMLLAESLGYSQDTLLHRLAPILRPLWQSYLRLRGGSKADNTRRLLAEARDLLIERSDLQSGQPLFVFINLMGTHVPYAPPAWALEQFVAPAYGESKWDDLLQWANQLQIDVDNWLGAPLADEERVLLHAIYDAEVAAQDRQVGLFLEALQAAGRLDNTMVAIVADHGDHLGDKDRVNHAFGVYNSLVHVPLLLYDPRAGSAPKSVDSAVSTIRLFHTFLHAASAATDRERALSLDGEEPIVTDSSTDAFSEGYPLQWALRRLHGAAAESASRAGYAHPVRAAYGDRYKLIVAEGWQELYDTRTDPTEEIDLSGQLPVVCHSLREQLEAFTRSHQPLAPARAQEGELDPQVRRQLRELGYLE